MAYTEASKKAVDKYTKANYDRFLLTVKKGQKDEIKAFAENQGKSLNGYINDLIEKDMKKAEE